MKVNGNNISLVNLLVQGLKGNSRSQIEEVLKHNSRSMIQATVTDLPLQHVVQFLNHLVSRLEDYPNRGSGTILWVQSVLRTHASFLCSLNTDEGSEPIRRLKLLFDSAIPLYHQVSRIHGRLSMMLNEGQNQIQYGQDPSFPTVVIDEPDTVEIDFEKDLLLDEDNQTNGFHENGIHNKRRKSTKNGKKKKIKTDHNEIDN